MYNRPDPELAARTVCVVGLGYIGLPTAAVLASRGYTVMGVDVRENVVETINSGRVHIVEPELDLLVKVAVDSGRLHASPVPIPADVFIICVPTPFHHNTHKPNIDYVEAASNQVAPFVRPGNIVVLESTSPPGTTQDVVGAALVKAGLEPGRDVWLAHCPERVLPGAILREVVENDRIVGGITRQCALETMKFYKTFVQGRILLTDAKTAEMVKLVENASRDVQIAFANELSLIAKRLGINPWEVIELANHHPRVKILQPGPGVGGHCIAVDPWFLVDAAPGDAKLIRAARERNDAMPAETAAEIARTARARGARTVALLGMAYKSDIDDCRESPSIHVHRCLREIAPELQIVVCEPNVATLPDMELLPFAQCVERADLLALLVAHTEFRLFDWSSLPAGKALLDFKGIKN